jgi:hypothetical protein
MAVIAEPRFRATDASGNAYAGATLTVYTAGTTTPASIYRNASLTTPMTNPSSVSQDKSDANGWFPEVFAVENQTFDVLIKDSSGNVLSSLISVPSVGSSSSNITKDYGTGGRLTLTGSAGSILMQAGPPVGDDTGGSLVLEGYGGTQLDALTLDAATVDTSGKFTENGKKFPGVIYTEATFSGSASVVIPLPNSPAGIRGWSVELIDVTNGSNYSLALTASVDGGGTYLAGTSYFGQSIGSYGSGPTSAGAYIAATSSLALTQTTLISGTVLEAVLRITVPSSIAKTSVRAEVIGESGGSIAALSVVGGFIGTASRLTNIKLTASAGTLSGRYRIIPLRGFGEA